MAKSYILATSDWHCNFNLGLMSPETVLESLNVEDGTVFEYQPALTYTQHFLWRCFQEDVAAAREIVGGAPVMLLHCGDIHNGKRFVSALVSTRAADEITISLYVMRYLLQVFPGMQVRGAYGTEVHNSGEGSSEAILFQMMRAMGVDAQMTRHGLLVYDGCEVDYAHHGPGPGIRNWLKGNVARYYLRDLMMVEIMGGKAPPRLVLRGHVHVPITEWLMQNGYFSAFHTVPSYCGISFHGEKVTQSQPRVIVGMILFEFENGIVNRAIELNGLHVIDTREREVVNHG